MTIKVKFSAGNGGTRSFAGSNELSLFADEQAKRWTEYQEPLSQRYQQVIAAIISEWRRFAGGVRGVLDPAALPEFLNSGIAAHQLLFEGLEGTALREIATDMGPEAIQGVVSYLAVAPDKPIFANMTKARVSGVFRFLELTRFAGRGSSKTVEAAFHELFSTLNKQMSQQSEELEALVEVAKDGLKHFSTTSQDAVENYKRDHAQMLEAADDVNEKREELWVELYDQFKEQLKLEAPVRLWDDRADQHQAAAIRYRRWAWGIGTVGLLLAFGVATGALEFAQWLFSDALVTGDTKLPANQLRPTWRYELAFAVSSMLLYLTLYLWVMRMIVRMFMTEHHLSLDANSRARMAHTYLALTKEGAAQDADRAIVLASLFRPTSDGIVKDDALPMISPATILSSQLAGKGG